MSKEEKEPVQEETTLSKEEELNTRIQELEASLEELKKDYDKKILEFIEKKSKEAAEIVEKKTKEAIEKNKAEFDQKLKYVYENPLSELVSIISQFEMVMKSITNPEVSSYLMGFNMFLSKFKDLLDSFSISLISPEVDSEFNSEVMEASSVKVVDREDLDNKIIKVLSQGYKLHDRVIKLASVEVGKFENATS